MFLLDSAAGLGGSGGLLASLALVARLSQPKGVPLFAAAGGSFGGGCGDGDLLVAGFVLLPHGTDGSEAEKFGNREGRGGGFMGKSLLISFSFCEWSMDCALDFTDCTSVTDEFRRLPDIFDTCDSVLGRTAAAVAI